jgi:hypothetical protein
VVTTASSLEDSQEERRMSTDQNAPGEPGSAAPGSAVPPQEPTWGAEQPAAAAGTKQSWSGRKTIAAVAIAVGIAAVGGTAIYAASGAVPATQTGGGPGGGMMGGGQGRGTAAPFGTALHGEFQVGQVTEVSSSSIAVKSTDGYVKTYTIDSTTVIGAAVPGQAAADLSTIANGDTVTVIGETTDGKTTAKSISERSTQAQPGQPGQAVPPGQEGVRPPRQEQGSGQPPTT